MKITLRREEKQDFPQVFDLIKNAFRAVAHSDHQEQFLVRRLRQSPAFVPALSIVAVWEEQIIGHILLSKIKIRNDERSFPSLALAPVSVSPDFQGKGIGGQLIEAAHDQARALGFQSVVLLGHEKYYPRFGYQRADHFGIRLPFGVPLENCMAIALVPGSLEEVEGIVEYDQAFFQ